MLLGIFFCTISLACARPRRGSGTTYEATRKEFLHPHEVPFGTRASCETLEFSDTEPPESIWDHSFPPDPDLSDMSYEYIPRSDENHTEQNLARRPKKKFPFRLNISHEMKEDFIVPFAIPVAPPNFANVSYKTGAKPWAGNLFSRNAIRGFPIIQWSCNKSELYTIFLSNLDGNYKGNTKKIKDIYFNERHHWLVVNIPECTISKGEVLLKYLAPINEKINNYYCYVILIYKQKEKLQIDHTWRKTPLFPTTTPTTTTPPPTDGIYKVEPRWKIPIGYSRVSFTIQEFVEKYNLGDPIAGNHFYIYDSDFKPFVQIHED